MQYSIFAVDTKPYCVWEWNLRERNLEFIESIDSGYFEYLAHTHYEKIEGENSQKAAIALRIGYHHGLETLFTLIGAALQAPDCVVGWVQKCWPAQLRNIVTEINSGYGNVVNKLGIRRVSWTAVAERIILYSHVDKERAKETKKLFAQLWSRFGGDFLEDHNIREYNSIKHGFRARPGGFGLAVGLEKEYGVSPPPEQMQTLCDSEFGTSFFFAERIQDAPKLKDRDDPHFRVHQYALNWHPEAVAHSLNLIAMSIDNVTSFLRIANGIDPKTVPFTRPVESEYFEAPWNCDVGVSSCSFDNVVCEKNIKRFSKAEILQKLKELNRE